MLRAEVDRDPKRRGDQQRKRCELRPAHERGGQGEDEEADRGHPGEQQRPVQPLEVGAGNEGDCKHRLCPGEDGEAHQKQPAMPRQDDEH